MRAAVYHRYGPPEVVTIRDVPEPTPNDDELLIRVRATTVSSGDCRIRGLQAPRGFGLMMRLVFGISAPRQTVLGTEGAGVIERVGKAVTRFKVGDEVIAYSGARMACHAELKCMKQTDALIRKPPQLGWHAAAALSFGGATALSFLRRARVQRGERVLINGASGSVGSAAVQLAVHFGASVTAVCSAANAELVRSLGADAVIDYACEDFRAGRERYDVIVDTVGNVTYASAKPVLQDAGRVALIAADVPAILEGVWAGVRSKQRVLVGPAPERAEDLELLAKLVQSGVYNPVIDRCLSFDQIADAHRLVDSRRKRGNVVVALD